jgi:hypothetical protein
MTHISVIVTDSNGRGASNVNVSVQSPGILGGFYPDVPTDGSGIAHIALDPSPAGKIVIYAKGKSHYEGYPEAKIYITI